MDRLIRYTFIITFCLLATAFSYNHKTVDFNVTIGDLILGFFTLLLFVMIMTRAVEWPERNYLKVLKRTIFPIFGLYFLAVIYSTIFAFNYSESIYKSCCVFTILVFIFTAVIALKDDRAFFKAVIFLTIGLGILYICQYVKYPTDMTLRKGTQGNMNQNASMFFLLCGLIAIYIARNFKRPVKKAIKRILPAAIAISMGLFAIFTLRTRTVWLAMIVSSIAAVPKRLRYMIPTAVLIVIAAAGIYKIKGPQILNTSSIKERKELWKQVIRQTKERPFFGCGAGNWHMILPLYERYMDYETRAVTYKGAVHKRTHNDFLQVLAEIGWIGIALYLLIFINALWYSRNNNILFGIITGFMVISFFSFPFERPFHRMALGVLIALAVNQKKPERVKRLKERITSPRLLKFAFAALGAAVCFCVYDFYIRYEVSLSTKRIYQAFHDRQIGTVLFETMSIHPLATVDNKGKPMIAMRGEAFYFIKKFKESKECFSESLKYNPNSLFSIMNMGSLETLAGRLKEARYWYEKAQEMYPDFEGAKKALHTVDVFEGKYYGPNMDNRRN